MFLSRLLKWPATGLPTSDLPLPNSLSDHRESKCPSVRFPSGLFLLRDSGPLSIACTVRCALAVLLSL